HAGERVHVPDALRVGPRHVDGAVNDESGFVGGMAPLVYGVTFNVNLDEAGSSDFIKPQAIRVDQEVMLRSGDARADVRVDELGPAEVVGDAVGAGELHPQRPFRWGDGGRWGEDGAHVSLLSGLERDGLVGAVVAAARAGVGHLDEKL